MKLAGLALVYWAPVFAFAFALGILRIVWIAPALGAVAATLVEVPLVVAASWLVARRLLTRNPGMSPQQALAVGLLGFALLMVAELALALMLGWSINRWLAGMQVPAGAIGLLGQIGFGLIPWLQCAYVRR